ncbi:uncharacterized protein FPRO_11551 [Fusarium proliferatum ET1]|uniref:F-box domain-containing protein n=1 Tax=Fusarium proliferatum (strain ET1) TaxID=1227346 RepID=A0A1L7W0D0_FUSPR|nr:uncharacterized protein FPRO_11551 [Fusarium proliferatum ET1]CZR46104.1 uncharacterized protein FPRO_11551 [Fusarium proliferatum ET1]
MASSSASGYQVWPDSFSAIQPEINIQILQYLSLQDIKSATVSSPMLLRTLQSNRQYILRPYLHDLHLSYTDISSFHLAASAMHLRELQSKHDGDTVPVLEKVVGPVLEYILRLNAKSTEEMGVITLNMVMAAHELLPEITDTFIEPGLLEEEEEEEKAEFRYRSPGSLWPDKAPLGIRKAFSDGFLRFDCYRNIFHHKGQDLFKERAGIKDAFLNTFPEFPKFDDKILRWYPYMILGRLSRRYGKVISRVKSTTRGSRGIAWPKGAWKEVLAAMTKIDFRNRSAMQGAYFKHRLVLQGYPKLAFLEQLSDETLLSTVEEEFEELVVSNLTACEAWAADKSHCNNLNRHFTLWRN